MNKKNKFIVLIIVLIILIISFKKIFVFESINYKLSVDGNNVKIKEVYKNDNYYIEIKTNENTYPIRIYNEFNNKRKIVENIYLYNDKSIECILPVIKGNIYTDFICNKDGILYNYNSNESVPNLDKYVESIDLYNKKDFSIDPDSTKSINSIKYNKYHNFNNITAITTYNGLIINDKSINIFKKDIYNNEISIFLNKYYMVANYEDKFSFDYFYIINIETKEINKLKLKESISYDSYIQGIVDSKIYLYDKDNENQYEIDIENNKINIVSSKDYIKYYSNKKWEKLNKVKANKEIYFNYDTLDNNFSNYNYVKESEDYYYLFKKDGISYKLYRVDKNNIDVYKYLINIPVTNIYTSNDYLYYIYKDKLYYYSDSTGLKIIYQDPELEFNNTIKYYIY